MRKGLLITGIVLLIIGAPLAILGANDVATINSYGVLGTLASNYQSAMAEAETLETVGGVLALVGLILIILGAVLRPASEKVLESGVHNEALKELNDKLVKGEIDKKQYKKLKKTMLK